MGIVAVAVAVPGQLPSALVNGRFFYEPTVGSRKIVIWMDTDGDGFVTQRFANEFHLSRVGDRARLPSEVLQPTQQGLLPVVAPDPSDAIFDGVDAQLGATWFDDRIVRFDYRRGALIVLETVPGGTGSLGRAALTFEGGYPRIEVRVAGKSYPMSVDTAATVVLTPRTIAALHDNWGPVRATSFVAGALLRDWHTAHPEWKFLQRAGADGVSMIEVPELSLGTFAARNVWFSTRPGDDVFQGETVLAKIGPTAYGKVTLTLDYRDRVAYFD